MTKERMANIPVTFSDMGETLLPYIIFPLLAISNYLLIHRKPFLRPVDCWKYRVILFEHKLKRCQSLLKHKKTKNVDRKPRPFTFTLYNYLHPSQIIMVSNKHSIFFFTTILVSLVLTIMSSSSSAAPIVERRGISSYYKKGNSKLTMYVKQ